MHFNSFGDAAAKALAEELPKHSAARPTKGKSKPFDTNKLRSKLLSVNLGANGITDASCTALGSMLENACTLHALLLDGNPITKDGAVALRKAAMGANAVVSLEGCSVLSHAERNAMNHVMERPRTS